MSLTPYRPNYSYPGNGGGGVSLTAVDMFRLSRRVESSESIAKGKLVLEINDHVKRAAEQGLVATVYNVPLILSGCPAYDHRTVCDMVVSHYRDVGGFKASMDAGGMMRLGWDLSNDESTRRIEQDDAVKFVFSREGE